MCLYTLAFLRTQDPSAILDTITSIPIRLYRDSCRLMVERESSDTPHEEAYKAVGALQL